MPDVNAGTDLAQVVRDLVDEVLRVDLPTGGKLNLWNSFESKHNPGGLTQRVLYLATSRKITTDGSFWPVVTEHLWTMARIGALALLPTDPSPIGGDIPHEVRQLPSFVITEMGRRLLSEPDFSPQDWAKYKAATLLRVSAPDDVVLAYLHEAVMARQGGLYRASVVMLGCACERLIILLAEAVRAAALGTYSAELARLLSSPRPVGIKAIFEQVRDAMLDRSTPLTPKLRDAIDWKLSPIFEYARALRNSHGHPTGAPVTAEDADTGLRLFPGVYALVDEVINVLPRAPAPPAPAIAAGQS
jgi:hypothetical protein